MECFICLDGPDPPARSGCACRGGAGYVHVECLVAKAVAQSAHRGAEAWSTCQTCEQRYTGAMSLALASAWCEREPHSTVAQCLLGSAMRRNGRCVEAEHIHRRVVAELRATLGDEHPETLACMGNLALALGDQYRSVEAERILREVVTAQRKNGCAHLSTESNFAHALVAIGKNEEAEAILREVVSTRRRELGRDHQATLQATCSLASTLTDLDEAEGLLVSVIASRRRLLGDDHEETLIGMRSLASVLKARNKHTEAEAMLRSVCLVARRTMGGDSEFALSSAHELALVMWRQQKLHDAAAILRDVVSTHSRALGASHPHATVYAKNLARLESLLARPTETRPSATSPTTPRPSATRPNATTSQRQMCIARGCDGAAVANTACARCNKVLYCSRVCKSADAKGHKRSCCAACESTNGI